MKRIARWLLILFVLQWAAGFGLSRWARRNLLQVLPKGAQVGTVQWRWPIGLRVRDMVLPDPAGEMPFLLKLKEGNFTVPLWVIWVRPLPVEMVLRSPHVQLHSGNLFEALQGLGPSTQHWLPLQMWEMEKSEKPPFPFVPLSLEIDNGRLDAFGKEIQPDRPIFSAAHTDLKVGLGIAGTEPVLNLSGYGHFVSDKDEIIGLHSMAATFYPQRRAGQGFLRLRHERMGDFQKIYEYAPRPIYIDSGMADTVLTGEVIGGNRVKITARCLVENLDLRGPVDGVGWDQIMKAVEDEGRRYEWVVHTEGNLDDPTFNPHDHILREVEYLMKEKAASRGLKIDGQMFFYADTPGGAGPLPADALRGGQADQTGLEETLAQSLRAETVFATGLEEGAQVLTVEDLARQGPLALRLASEVAGRKRAGVALLPVKAVPAARAAFDPKKIELWMPASAQKGVFNNLIPSSFRLAEGNTVHHVPPDAAEANRQLQEAARGAEAEGKTVVAVLYENLYLEQVHRNLLVPGIVMMVVRLDTLDRVDRTDVLAAYLSQPDLLRGVVLDLTSGSPIPRVTLDDKEDHFAVDRWV